MTTTVGLKTCRRCTREQPLDNFNADAKMKDGKRTLCRLCQSELNKQKTEERRATRIKRHNENATPTEPKAIRATANRNALLRLMQNHIAEFEEIVKSETLRLTAMAGDPEAKKVWISLD